MPGLLDFENQEKGFERFYVNRINVLKNVGKRICYVDYVEPYRGTYFVRHGVIHGIKHSRLLLNNGDSEVDVRDIKEAGIEIDKTEEGNP